MRDIEEILRSNYLFHVETGFDGGRCCIKFRSFLASIQWSYGAGWEHVSIAPLQREYTPSWDDMCKLKDMFFYEHETVIQVHPAKDDYVNMLGNCLHLWRCTYRDMVLPPSFMVGMKKGQTMDDIDREYEKYCKYIEVYKAEHEGGTQHG